jgi:hypothetical protein
MITAPRDITSHESYSRGSETGAEQETKNPRNLLLCHGIMPPYGFLCVLDFFQVCVRPPAYHLTISIPSPSQPNPNPKTWSLIAEKTGPVRQKKLTEERKTPVCEQEKTRHSKCARQEEERKKTKKSKPALKRY